MFDLANMMKEAQEAKKVSKAQHEEKMQELRKQTVLLEQLATLLHQFLETLK